MANVKTPISYEDVTITGGFWKEKQDMVRNVTMRAVYDRFKDTGRFEGMKLRYKEGEPNRPHIFFDSDVAKWLEGAAYLLQKQPDEFLTSVIEEVVDDIIAGQDENGYFNQYFLQFEQENRFKKEGDHELYCLGHLVEAAVAYYRATGRDRFLKAMCRYVDYVDRVFRVERSAAFVTPGHEELELALIKLYECTGEEKYLTLARYFIDQRGAVEEPGYGRFENQKHAPVRDQHTAEGHSVRAGYLYSAMADLAALDPTDERLNIAVHDLFENIVDRRMYITGGIGSTSRFEGFTGDYDLPNLHAYTETCATLSLALFARRMEKLDGSARYAETAERAIYNGFLSGVSLDGRAFFYENPLELDPEYAKMRRKYNPGERYPISQRLEVFGCSCCPPNVVRFIASIGDFIFSREDNGNIVIEQYADATLRDGERTLHMYTDYPRDGRVELECEGGDMTVKLRVPSWMCSCGYREIKLKAGERFVFDIDMRVRFIESNPAVRENCGRVAVMRGPLVYCLEGVDNGKNLRDIKLDIAGVPELYRDERIDAPCIQLPAVRREIPDGSFLYREYAEGRNLHTVAKLIPYYAYENRGDTAMLVWAAKL